MSTRPPVLYGYWRSTAAFRVRIALALKGIEYQQRAVHLVQDGGQQHRPEFKALNPAGLVPALLIDGLVLSQSLAICEYLDETRPAAPLLPSAPAERAMARAIALDLACDMHPLNNLRVQHYLRGPLQQTPEAVLTWMHHWMQAGFEAIELRLQQLGGDGRFCVGQRAGLADIFLVAQAYNADRFDFSLTAFPLVTSITAYCRSLPPFQAAAPGQQPDAQHV